MMMVLLAQAEAGDRSIPWLSITTDVLIPTVAALLAALVAIVTYIWQRLAKHRDVLRDLFSEALRAVADYQELPYLVRRRSGESPMKASELIFHASDIQTRLDYFSARLRLESPQLGDAYSGLVRTVRQESGAHISEAWNEDRLTGDKEMPLGTHYPRDRSDAEKAVCIKAMQKHLGIANSDSSGVA